jgi:hypothetical protein
MTPMQRVKLSARLGAALKELKAATGAIQRIKLSGQVSAILAQLGAAAPPAAAVKADLNDVHGTLQSMMDYLEAAPADEKPTVAMYLDATFKYLNRTPQMHGGKALPEETRTLAGELVGKVRQQKQDSAKYLQTISALGQDAYDYVAPVTAADSATEQSKQAAQKIIDESDAVLEPMRRAHQAKVQELTDLAHEAHLRGDSEASEKYWAEMQAEMDSFYKSVEPIKEGALRSLEGNRQVVAKAFSALGDSVVDTVLESSPVTDDAAQQWAAAQEITKTAAKRLKKFGYPVEQVRLDMARFYRLSHGRLASVVIASKGNGRANAQEIHGFGESIINLGSYFNSRVLFHELAHHLEADPMLLHSAKAFLEKRRKSDRTVSLRKLTKNTGYRPHEKAYEDDFFDPYIGKVYPDATEVMSMGAESFSDPEILAKRMGKDPEMFAFILGAMRAKPHPLYETIKTLRRQAAAADAKKAEDTESEYQELLEKYVAGMQLQAPLNFNAISVEQSYALRKSRIGDAKIIGEWEGLILVEGNRVFNDATRRRGRGHAIVESVSTDARGITYAYSARYVSGSLDFAKGCMRAIHDTQSSLREGDLAQIRRLVNGT